jgi:2'-phosphotransferase
MSCFGVVVLNNDSVLIVKTHKNNYGFPKGKIDNKKDSDNYACALRELYEETGLTDTMFDVVDNTWLSEVKENGNTNIQYLVARFTGDATFKFTFDPEELETVGWYTFEDAYKVLWERRAKILKDAISISASATFVPAKREKVYTKKPADKYVSLSKTMSWLLRHKAKDLGLNMSNDGYVLLDDMLALSNFRNITVDDIKHVVDTNDKQRFSLKEESNKLYIRANQGHSKQMSDLVSTGELLQKITKPYSECIHGTTKKAYQSIKKHGLNRMNRMHIHFAIGLTDDDKVISGFRKSSEVLIYIDMEKAMKDGIEFYLSDNKVILSEGIKGIIEPKYFKQIVEN